MPATPGNRRLGPSKDHSAQRRRHRQPEQCLWAVVECSFSNPVAATIRPCRTRIPQKTKPGQVLQEGTGETGKYCKKAFCRAFLSYACRVESMVARCEM